MTYDLHIPRPYHQLLPYSFKRFSVLSAARTLVPTLVHYALRTPMPTSDKPALFTMNILPPMMTVWHHLARKYLGDAVDIVVFDCSGRLDPSDVPGARVQKFLNLYAATKCNEFLRHIAQGRRTAWLCDDDMFFTGSGALDILQREFAVPNTATVSFRPRGWWEFDIDGQRHQPSGSYCLAIDRPIVVGTEKLSLAPCDGNDHPSVLGRPPGRYDTFDKANEALLQKGYRCAIVPKEEADRCVTGFAGMSGAVMLLSYFRTPEQVMNYYDAPPLQQWTGNVLYGTLCAMLAIRTIQECYEQLKGQPYQLPSLPSRHMLEQMRKSRERYLRPDQSFGWIDEVSEKLKKAL